MAARAGLFVSVALAGLFALPCGASFAAEDGAWAQRVQLVYSPDTRTVARRTVRVWNPEPEKNLDFVWEPEAGATLGSDGTVNGRGKLTWRVRGSANYDPKTVYSTYRGDMKDGRPHGEGRHDFRTGAFLEGSFAAGLLEGQGVSLDTDGTRYEGAFRAGLPDGMGRLTTTKGDIYVGAFAAGKKHGSGETRLAGGATYRSQWTMGVESGRPALLADATLGGLLRAQSGGDAGKVEISVGVEPRLTAQTEEWQGVAYQHLVRDEDIAIYPLDQQMNDLWNGTAEVSTYSSDVFYDRDWEYAPAFVEVDLHTTDGSRVKLDKLQLEVANSEAYRKPMLSLMQHVGCTGFRPSFSIRNDGWGEVRDMTLNVKFAGGIEPGLPQSRDFSTEVGSFDKGIDVGLRGVFEEAGVDTAALDGKRFSCQSMDAIGVCRSQVFNEVGFGEIADYVWGENKLWTTARGTLDYSWADDAGTVYQASEPFQVNISMTIIETQDEAECGAGFGGSPEAMRYQDVRFPVGQRNYAIDMPVRGNKNISSYAARLKMQSEPAMSSFHQFSVAATFADGSVRKSKPVSFFFLKPRISDFAPGMMPPACYLSEGAYGC